MKTGKTFLKKNYTKALILNFIKRRGHISRTKLQQITNIRMATITTLVKELMDEGLVREAGYNESSRGRRQVLLQINPAGAWAIGLEFDADKVNGAIVNLGGEIKARVERKFTTNQDREPILKEIVTVLNKIIQKSGTMASKLRGIGIADPGLVDRHRGVSIFASNIKGWRNVPLRKILEKEFSLPVSLEGGSRAKALAESWLGTGKGIEHLISVDLEVGIGCGIISHGRLIRGSSEFSGELGHTHVIEDGPLCKCGSYGCLDAIASESAIIAHVQEAINRGTTSLANKKDIDIKTIFEAGKKGDKLCRNVLARAGHYLGVGIANLVNLLNPEMIIFGGHMVEAQDLLLKPVERAIKTQALEVSCQSLKIEISKLGDTAGVLGGAILVLEKVFEMPKLLEEL